MNWFNHYRFGGILLGGKVPGSATFDANLSVSKDSMRLSQDRTEGLTMKLIDFDSSQYAKRLREAGLAQPIADIEAETMGEMGRYLAALSAEAAQRDVTAEAARKETDAKIDTAIAGLNAKIVCLGAELRAQMSANQGALIRWVVTVGVLQSALVTALVLKLVH